ncbi:MAG: RNA-binding protein [Chloroflexi bacterium]|nr:MAG: RNA-binding protein [Chloroflexota bacterium]
MNTKLYIGNLSPITTAEDLRYLFSSVGMVVSVELIKDRNTGKPKGYAFVEMVSQGDTGKAVSEFNNYNLDQRQIKVSVAKTNSPQPRHTSRYVEYKSYNESINKSS